MSTSFRVVISFWIGARVEFLHLVRIECALVKNSIINNFEKNCPNFKSGNSTPRLIRALHTHTHTLYM